MVSVIVKYLPKITREAQTVNIGALPHTWQQYSPEELASSVGKIRLLLLAVMPEVVHQCTVKLSFASSLSLRSVHSNGIVSVWFSERYRAEQFPIKELKVELNVRLAAV